MPIALAYYYEFDPYRIDPIERVLYRHQEALHLSPKLVETLLFLLENAGHIIEKEDFQTRLWPDTFVEEINLARNISLLRKTLSEGAEGQQFIETIPKRGYRFLAEVKKAQLLAPPVVRPEEVPEPPLMAAVPVAPQLEPLPLETPAPGASKPRTRVRLIPTLWLLGLLGVALFR